MAFFHTPSPLIHSSSRALSLISLIIRLQSATGTHHDLSVHMDALEKMVRMRGGLQQLGWDGVLQMFISWWVTTRNKIGIVDND